MASKTLIRIFVDGSKKKFKRKRQGRTPSGLGKPKLIRLKLSDEEKIKLLKEKFGYYWNENEFIRDAVSEKLCNSVYIELL
jgi:hypothetical protein